MSQSLIHPSIHITAHMYLPDILMHAICAYATQVYWVTRHLSMGMGASNCHLRTTLRVLGCVSMGDNRDSVGSGDGGEGEGREGGGGSIQDNDEECPLSVPVIATEGSCDGSSGSDGGSPSLSASGKASGGGRKARVRAKGKTTSPQASPQASPQSSPEPEQEQEQKERAEQQGRQLEEQCIVPAVIQWLSLPPPGVSTASASAAAAAAAAAAASASLIEVTHDTKRLKTQAVANQLLREKVSVASKSTDTSPAVTNMDTVAGAGTSRAGAVQAAVSQQLHRGATYLFMLALGSVSREVLLRLKEYMKVTYGLSDERCAAYCPFRGSSSLSSTTSTTSSASTSSASVTLTSSTSSSSSSSGGGGGVGRFAGEMGIPVGLHFEPFAPPSISQASSSGSTRGSSTVALCASSCGFHPTTPASAAFVSSSAVFPPLWKVIQCAAEDHNRMLLLLSEGGCDFNMTSSFTRNTHLRKNKKDSSRKKTPGIGKKNKAIGKKRKRQSAGVLKRRSSLDSITEENENEAFDSEGNESEDDDEYHPTSNHLKRSSSTSSSSGSGSGSGRRSTSAASATPPGAGTNTDTGTETETGGSRSSSRKKNPTRKLGDYATEGGEEEVDEAGGGGAGGGGWRLDTSIL